MEYLRARGEHADVPLHAMLATFREKYPHMYGGLATAEAVSLGDADFNRDVEEEIADTPAERST